MKELICIVCPKGCHMQVDEENNYAVTGNCCPRGYHYGRSELTNPTRVITSTVCVEGGIHPRVCVKTDRPIAKRLMPDIMSALDTVSLHAPVAVGDIIIENVCGSGANIVATRNL